jgi:hypothetical protein
MADLWKFLLAVKEQWRRLVTGSLAIGLLGLFQETKSSFHVPSYAYWLIICVTLFWAFFGAWRKEYRKGILGLAFRESLRARCNYLIKEWAELNRLCDNNLLDPLMQTWASSKNEFIPFKVGSLQSLTEIFYIDMIRASISMPKYDHRISVQDLLETLRDCKRKLEVTH